jgi:outer membrane biosynthesis protein TonB
VIGLSFWQVYPEQAVFYFSQVASAAPGLRDGTGWSASGRYLASLVHYGDWFAAREDWCEAVEKYDAALSMGADAAVKRKAEEAQIKCEPPTETPEPSPEPSETSAETTEPVVTPEDTPTSTTEAPTETQSSPPTETQEPSPEPSETPTSTQEIPPTPTDTSPPPVETEPPPAIETPAAPVAESTPIVTSEVDI